MKNDKGIAPENYVLSTSLTFIIFKDIKKYFLYESHFFQKIHLHLVTKGYRKKISKSYKIINNVKMLQFNR